MGELIIKLPDIGEGITEAEISEWLVEVGEWVQEDDIIGVVLTDKAAVEIPSSTSGLVLWRAGDPGDVIAIGAPLVKIDPEGSKTDTTSKPKEDTAPLAEFEKETAQSMGPKEEPTVTPSAPPKVLAAPAVRRRAADLGIDLAQVTATGSNGQISHADLDRTLGTFSPPTSSQVNDQIVETKIIGLRRKIAEQMARANAHIPQITIVEEVDVTELERLRAKMNEDRTEVQPKLTLLPFLMRTMVRAREAAPQVNSRYDDETGVLSQFGAVHLGMAAQTDQGLTVPVLRNADTLTVWQLASEISRLAKGARARTLAPEELSGSTITLTSLGPLGAVASTPIVNYPEVAILGVNRKQIRPMWDGQAFVPREIMNISASFDHRIVDGWDAATFVARLKTLLETPALLFA